jgi:hypothetical protein
VNNAYKILATIPAGNEYFGCLIMDADIILKLILKICCELD